MLIVGILMGEKVPRQSCGGHFFQQEVSLNPSNHSTTAQIFERSQNTFNVLNTNYSTYYKSFNVVQIIQLIINRVQIIQRS